MGTLMRAIYIFSIILLFGFFASCSPVRSRHYYDDTQKKAEKETLSRQEDNIETESNFADTRFLDTAVVIMPIAQNGTQSRSLNDFFSDAVRDFDKENYKTACSKFDAFSGMLRKNDSLYFETMFYKSECNILNNELGSAKNILEMLLEDSKTPDAIYEKILVRLGQVYCITDSKDKAEEMFSRLKKEYPNSIYLKLADCNVVE